ncbi:MAG: threonylcarbamoyl-AMP synthase [Planctomycetaceae bacterium]|nr:threonylcarbamoyl-AMP synthase [Planctomycetaceae bacterium]
MTCPITTDVDRAAAILRNGGLVAFGTETVYGLGANVFDVRAVARVFEAKGRPTFDPLIVHLAEPADIMRVAAAFPPTARQLTERFWPGPLTLILPKLDTVPDLVTAGLHTVAVRVPNHRMARQLISLAGVPIAAPSANPFGEVSPTTADHVVQQLGDRIDCLLDGGPSRVGLESTVLDVSGEHPVLLRPGGVTQEEIESVVGRVERGTTPSGADEHGTPQRAPGLLSRHYAPRTRLAIQVEAARPSNPHTGLLLFRPDDRWEGYSVVEVLSEGGDLREAAANFYAAVRRLDACRLEQIVAVPFPEVGLGRALNDRLRRAATASGTRL